jgi:ABC-type glycerol-3-phosphate transport system permease component
MAYATAVRSQDYRRLEATTVSPPPYYYGAWRRPVVVYRDSYDDWCCFCWLFWYVVGRGRVAVYALMSLLLFCLATIFVFVFSPLFAFPILNLTCPCRCIWFWLIVFILLIVLLPYYLEKDN